MRKKWIPPADASPDSEDDWLDLEALASVEISSEDPAFPVEGALLPGGSGWRAAGPGTQILRLLFDTPRTIRRVRLVFDEPHAERTQEFSLHAQVESERSSREVVRQQWNFSPEGASAEVEDYSVDLSGVTVLELRIVPDISGRPAVASLSRLRLA